MSVPIDKGVTLPKRSNGGVGKGKYPWREMEVGDSFLFPPTVSAGSAAARYNLVAKRLGRKFTIRTTSEGIRCWRIE